MISGFDYRVTNATTGTGSGHSINLGDVFQEQLCSVGSGDLRPHVTITGPLGGLSNSTVAVCRTDAIHQSGLRLDIVGVGIKTVTDACKACCLRPCTPRQLYDRYCLSRHYRIGDASYNTVVLRGLT